jgi:hypothetical protein
MGSTAAATTIETMVATEPMRKASSRDLISVKRDLISVKRDLISKET